MKPEPIKKEDQESHKYRRKTPNKLSREEVELDLNNRLEKKKNKQVPKKSKQTELTKLKKHVV